MAEARDGSFSKTGQALESVEPRSSWISSVLNQPVDKVVAVVAANVVEVDAEPGAVVVVVSIPEVLVHPDTNTIANRNKTGIFMVILK